MPPERQDFVSRAWDLLRPDSYSVGISQTAPASPVKGVLLMQTPWGSWPWETSPTTGRNETTIVGNLRTPWKAGDWGIGGNAQLGLDPVRGAGGVAFVQTFDNPVMPFTVIGTTRYGVRPDTNQTVVSASVGVNTPVDAVVSRGLFVGAAVAAAIPPLAPAAPVLLRAGAAVDQAGRAWGQALPRPVVGVGWQGELRWTNGHDGSPPEFDGLYRRNQRVDLPDAVENAIAQESQGALMPEAGPVGSFAARVATNVLEALPPAGEWADAIPEAARPGLAVVAESIAEEMRDPTLMVPSPLGLARHLVENAREAGLMPFTPPGAAGWAETLLGLQPSR
jgi:hypothetical protein